VITLRLASTCDDDTLRAMLRENPMPSWVSMSIEREPSLFEGLNRFGQERVVIAQEGRAAVGMYMCAEHLLHINGSRNSLGYLGALRISPHFRHRLSVLRAGFDSIRQLSGAAQGDTWYTSVAADNRPARRLLEAGIRGLPRYEPVGKLVTLALPRSRGRRHGFWQQAEQGELAAICEAHNHSAAAYQLSPLLTPELALSSGAAFYVHRVQGQFSSCMALWDQRTYKQVVAHAYRQPLRRLIPLYNAWARMARRVELPPVGNALEQSFLAFFASATEEPDAIIPLVQDALALCPTQTLCLGLHGGHRALPALQKTFRPLAYSTMIYAVCFEQPPVWDDRPVQPEAAIL
jgi:hypothetical protein